MAKKLPDWLKQLYPFTPKTIDVGAGRMSYLDEGKSDKAVLMAHGNPTWSFFYRNVALALRQKFRCIIPDHLGCGLSDKPQDYAYTLPNHIANLSLLLERFPLKKIHLILHDWGGPIGLGALLPQPEKLGRVVIMNTAAFADTHIPARIRLCRAPILGELLVRGLNSFSWSATWMAVTRPLPRDVKRGFLFPYDSWTNRIATHRFVADIPTGKGTPSDTALAQIESQLLNLRKKDVLILWGGADFCFRKRYYERWLELLPEAEANLFPQAGHYLIEDDPSIVRLIERHFTKPDS